MAKRKQSMRHDSEFGRQRTAARSGRSAVMAAVGTLVLLILASTVVTVAQPPFDDPSPTATSPTYDPLNPTPTATCDPFWDDPCETPQPTATCDPFWDDPCETPQARPMPSTLSPTTSQNDRSSGETAAGSSCSQAGMNVQCTEFGSIQMDARRDIRGEPLDVTAHIELETDYEDEGARWVMFSVRNQTDEGASPLTIGLKAFSTPNGDIVTSRVEQTKPSELNLWVDVLDLPVGQPISLEVNVGATERGAYSLEALVLAFDRAYEPIQTTGGEASLFSFTVLGVNKASASTAGDDDSFMEGRKLPALGPLAVLAILGLVLGFLVRRRSK